MTYTTTPELLKTVAALAVPTASASASSSVSGTLGTATRSQSAPVTEFTGAANAVVAANGAALAGALGFAAFLV